MTWHDPRFFVSPENQGWGTLHAYATYYKSMYLVHKSYLPLARQEPCLTRWYSISRDKILVSRDKTMVSWYALKSFIHVWQLELLPLKAEDWGCWQLLRTWLFCISLVIVKDIHVHTCTNIIAICFLSNTLKDNWTCKCIYCTSALVSFSNLRLFWDFLLFPV